MNLKLKQFKKIAKKSRMITCSQRRHSFDSINNFYIDLIILLGLVVLVRLS